MNWIKTGMALAATGILLAVSSCNRTILDADDLEKLTQHSFPIDTVDIRHDWNLVQKTAISITPNVPNDNNISKVQILTENPYQVADAEVMAEKEVQGGNRVVLTVEMPISQTDFWVAAINRNGKYYVVPSAGKTDISFDGNNVVSSGTLKQPVPQTFTYLFEENFPMPGDFDFNDVVLRISKENPAPNIVKLHVTLAAVGADKVIGAAIRLPGIAYDDIESITVDGGKRFDEDYPVYRYFISNDDIYSRGLDGTAVVNLFDDAHWVLNAEEKDGRFVRMHYNTTKFEKKNESAHVPTQSRTYTIVTKDHANTAAISLSTIDPFIIENYNSINMEVHTYKYKYAQVLWQYHKGQTADKDLIPWALLIPSAKFQYPVEAMPIGYYRNATNFGAYSRNNHSFGQWARNKDVAQDWWHYPSSTLVY